MSEHSLWKKKAEQTVPKSQVCGKPYCFKEREIYRTDRLQNGACLSKVQSEVLLPGFASSVLAVENQHADATQETRVWSLGWENSLEKEMATHSSILAWRTPWTEEPGWLQSMLLKSIWLKRLSSREPAPSGGAVVPVVDCIQQLLPLSQRSRKHLLKNCWVPGSMKSARGGVVSNTRRIFFEYFIWLHWVLVAA